MMSKKQRLPLPKGAASDLRSGLNIGQSIVMDAKFVGNGGSIAQPDDFVKFSPRDAAEFTGDGDVKFSKRVTDKESKNVYKTHRILMPDGSAFEYKENAEPTPARGVAINGSYASPISSASASIVAENPEDVKFSMRPTDTPQFKRWFKGSKVINGDGSPKILYHQTNADFTEFDVGRQGAGYNDSEMPSGVYMKEFPDTIKLGADYKSSIQMALYASIQSPWNTGFTPKARGSIIHVRN